MERLLRLKKFLLGTLLLTAFFVWIGYTATSTRLPATKAPPSFFSNHCRDDLEMTFSKAIDRASDSVHLSIYTLTDPRILRSINRLAEEGKEVVILYDAKHSYGLSKKLHENVTKIKRKPRGLMHQKILVIDGKEVWIGSANMTYESLRMHGNLVIALDSPVLAETLIAQITSRNTRGPPTHDFISGGQAVEYWQLPINKGALARLLTLLDNAEFQIRVAMFTFTHPKLTEALIRADQRGLQVEVVIDRNSSRGASKKTVARLQEAGVPVRISEGQGLLHHKLAWIDESTLVCGSANWTKSAFTRNEDCFLILHDLDENQKEYLEKMWRVLCYESTSTEET